MYKNKFSDREFRLFEYPHRYVFIVSMKWGIMKILLAFATTIAVTLFLFSILVTIGLVDDKY
jgi:hypothetical protein